MDPAPLIAGNNLGSDSKAPEGFGLDYYKGV